MSAPERKDWNWRQKGLVFEASVRGLRVGAESFKGLWTAFGIRAGELVRN